mmetsp:Transcript_70650/g.188346  ORF Transcript_70650/g.188346 Transcript_70650/m.188346 type:complete len:301 (+) Transcript_70650:2519-3421(+)
MLPLFLLRPLLGVRATAGGSLTITVGHGICPLLHCVVPLRECLHDPVNLLGLAGQAEGAQRGAQGLDQGDAVIGKPRHEGLEHLLVEVLVLRQELPHELQIQARGGAQHLRHLRRSALRGDHAHALPRLYSLGGPVVEGLRSLCKAALPCLPLPQRLPALSAGKRPDRRGVQHVTGSVTDHGYLSRDLAQSWAECQSRGHLRRATNGNSVQHRQNTAEGQAVQLIELGVSFRVFLALLGERVLDQKPYQGFEQVGTSHVAVVVDVQVDHEVRLPAKLEDGLQGKLTAFKSMVLCCDFQVD